MILICHRMNHSVERRLQALHQTHHHYYLNITVEAANLSDWRIDSNRIETFFTRIGMLYSPGQILVMLAPRCLNGSAAPAYSSLQLASPLREVTYKMASHSVICHPADVTFSPVPPAKPVLDLAISERCKAELTSLAGYMMA